MMLVGKVGCWGVRLWASSRPLSLHEASLLKREAAKHSGVELGVEGSRERLDQAMPEAGSPWEPVSSLRCLSCELGFLT